MDAPETVGARARVLIVDDDDLARQLVGDVLTGAGYRVSVAGDGVRALDMLGRATYELVLADWRMPTMDGVELIREAQRLGGVPPPFVILTSLAAPDLLAEALDAGAEDYIVKPVDRVELLARVRAVLRSDRVRAGAEQGALRAIAEAVARSVPPGDVMDLVARCITEVNRAATGAVARFEDERTVYVGRWPDDDSGRPAPFPRSAGRASALAHGPTPGAGPMVVTSGLDEALPGVDTEALGAAVVAPVTVADELWGAVVLGLSDDAHRGAPIEEGLRRFGELVALAVQSAEDRDALTTRAGTDPLTGLPNRRVFFDRLEGELARVRRHGRDLSIAVVDIDHFKAINDTYGHQAGDAVLRELAWRLSEAARSGDVVGRIGGEEFAWLLPETDSMEAWQAAERARASVAGSAFPGAGRVTISAGVCDLAQATGAEDLFSKADSALYWAKSQGRDVVFLYSPDVMAVLSPEERQRQLRRNQAFQGVRTLARAVDGKDPSTRRHSERVAALAEQIALELGWTPAQAVAVREAGLVHDVGKIAVPDDLLFKPDLLTPAERARVEIHASLGADVVGDIFDAEQISWVRGHHERWDGEGYPDGLTREEAPEGARILHLADAYDVMTAGRPYQPALTADEALEECRAQSARQFWPRAVEALEALHDDDRIPPPLEPLTAGDGVSA